MTKLAYLNLWSGSTGVYDDFLHEFGFAPIRDPRTGDVIERDSFDGYIQHPAELVSIVTSILTGEGYTIAGPWEMLNKTTARVTVTSETAGHQPREHAVKCMYCKPGAEGTFHHTGICDYHDVFRPTTN